MSTHTQHCEFTMKSTIFEMDSPASALEINRIYQST